MKHHMLFWLLLPLFAALPLAAFSQSTWAEPTASTYRVAKTLIIPEANFHETLPSDALALFQKESIAADPEKNGIHFILKTSGSNAIVVSAPESISTIKSENKTLSSQ